MHLGHRSLACSALGIIVASCGGVTEVDSSTGKVTGAFTVVTDVPNAGNVNGASYRRGGGFTSAQPTCASQKIGACQVDPCYVSVLIDNENALLSAGPVTILGAAMTPDALAPQANGAYAPEVVHSQIPWTTGGESVTIQWAHFPGDTAQPGGTFTLATPPYVALQSGSPFADSATSTFSRDKDLSISWTSDSSPGANDRVIIDIQSGSTEVNCSFDASAGGDVVPSAALQFLNAGQGTYDVHSKEYASQKISGANGATWTLQFNVDAHARTSYGLAKGAVTIE
jgi:hypothetical protein